jgi:hypothetical protein
MFLNINTIIFLLGIARINPHTDRVRGRQRGAKYHDLRVVEHLRANPSAYDIVQCWPGAMLATAAVASGFGAPVLREVPDIYTVNYYEFVEQIYAQLDLNLKQDIRIRQVQKPLRRGEECYDAAKTLLLNLERAGNSFRPQYFCLKYPMI